MLPLCLAAAIGLIYGRNPNKLGFFPMVSRRRCFAAVGLLTRLELAEKHREQDQELKLSMDARSSLEQVAVQLRFHLSEPEVSEACLITARASLALFASRLCQ